MKRLWLLVALGWPTINVAGAQSLELTEGAAELQLSDMTLPAHAFGSVIYTSCETCTPQVRQVDSSTVYVGPSGPVSLGEFLNEAARLMGTAEGQETFVGLFYSLADERVTRIRLYSAAE